jgi:periplasmic divalent cation tolerance protein
MTTDYAVVLTTIGAEADAGALATRLVEERLAACVNILPEMVSIYRWQGRIQQDRERQLLMKTTAARVPALEARIRELHAFEVPEFLVLRVEQGSEAYLRWVAESVAD